ncbi:MAG: dihydrolipoyl dehydrogenase [Actinomycetota bacterium]|nr:dihydrolipoyl dehydrogenase [Actinomycetota bacterium]
MDTNDYQFDVAVIGGGPGGYPAAIRAAQRGAKVVLIEKDKVGGTCLNRGCIPTKTLLASSELVAKARKASEFGVKIESVEPEWQLILERKNRVTETLVSGIHGLLKANGIQEIKGHGKIVDKDTIEVEKEDGVQKVVASRIIIATGSSPAELPAFDFSKESVLTSTDALELEKVPSSLIIVGSGVVGSEFASIFSTLGTKVTMVELMDRMLPTEDSRISKQMRNVFRKEGIEILTKTTVERVSEYKKSGISVELSNGQTLEAEKLLVSIGRSMNSKNLGLEDIGVETDKRGSILVDEKMETSVKGIYGAGDVTGGILLAHTATAEGLIAAENSTGGSATINEKVVPACIFTDPEIASVGLNPDKAKEAEIEVEVTRFSFGALGKALAMGEDRGFVQLALDPETKKILGAQIMGPHASDLIHEIAVAMNLNATAQDIAHTIHAHPSLPESIMEAAEAALGTAIHVAPKR